MYKIGDTVWVAPINWCDLKGVVVGFQALSRHLPIVQMKIKIGRKIIVTKSAFDLDRINPYHKGKVR